MKRIALAALLSLVAWGIYQNKFTVSFSKDARGMKAVYRPEPIEVHPEVLNLQESFAKVAELVKPAVVNISTVHLEQYQTNPYEFFFMNPEDLFDQFFDFQGDRRGDRQRQTLPQQKKNY